MEIHNAYISHSIKTEAQVLIHLKLKQRQGDAG